MPRQNIIKTKLLHSASCYCSLHWSQHSIIPLMDQSEGPFPWPTAKISRETQTSETNSIELMISPLCLLPQFSSQQREGFFPLFDWKAQKFATLSSHFTFLYICIMVFCLQVTEGTNNSFVELLYKSPGRGFAEVTRTKVTSIKNPEASRTSTAPRCQ